MSKPKLPNQRKANQAHNARTEQYVRALDSVYDTFNKEAAKLSLITDYDGSAPFRWKDFPETKARLNKLMSGWTNSINTTIVNGVAAEWNEANINLDKVAKQALRRHKVNPGDKRYNKYFGNNESALKSFLAREDKGMNLSRKVWNMKQDYKEGLEAAISCGIDDGTSAVQLSKKISQYLKDFETLKGDYTEKFGSAADIKDCEYRSARLARSEINMAYHSAGQERWKDMDFVVGYEVKRSGGLDSEDSLKSYPCPVCEDLAGKYPKDFKFVGWHPNCRCYTIPILKTDEEFWAYDGRGEETAESANEVKDVPDNFKKWVVANKERIADAELHGTLPYFVRDNYWYVDSKKYVTTVRNKAISVGDELQSVSELVAKKYDSKVTPLNVKSIESITRKCNTDKSVPDELKDVIRNTIVANKYNIESILRDFESNPMCIRIKRQSGNQFYGYNGNIVNLKLSNGTIGEAQVNTSKMIYAKEEPRIAKSILGDDVWNAIKYEVGVEGGLGHKYYEQIRTLNPLKDSEKISFLIQKSVEYYSKFK